MKGKPKMNTTLRSQEYAEVESKLFRDPAIKGMAQDLEEAIDKGLISTEISFWESFEFMRYCNKEYASRGGTENKFIGSVANVLRALVLGE